MMISIWNDNQLIEHLEEQLQIMSDYDRRINPKKEKHEEHYDTYWHGPSESRPQAETSGMTLPLDSEERKQYPLYRGCLKYFPAALAGVAKTSKLGNDKHNPGQELHHARGKSSDHGDCIIRHLMDVSDLLARPNATLDQVEATREQVLLEVNQMVWRALAFSQELHEKFGSPLAPGAKRESK